jgi:AraC-like DNA-binding protein
LDEFFCRHTTQNWPEIDPRIEKVIALVKSSIDDSLSVEELAKSVNLSVPRLVQLFKSQTGVTIRRYRLWHRLFLTAVRLGNGENLTHAAQGAGFTDSAHCCHTFRAILGMKPTLLLNQPNGIDIVSPREELRDLSA